MMMVINEDFFFRKPLPALHAKMPSKLTAKPGLGVVVFWQERERCGPIENGTNLNPISAVQHRNRTTNDFSFYTLPLALSKKICLPSYPARVGACLGLREVGQLTTKRELTPVQYFYSYHRRLQISQPRFFLPLCNKKSCNATAKPCLPAVHRFFFFFRCR